MRHSTLLGCVLSLLLIPAFAAYAGTGGERGSMDKESGHHGHWFQKLDKDGDGKISRDEFKESMGKKFDRMDADNDGFVTKEEWKAAKQKKMERMREHHGGEHRGGGEQQDMEGM
jgi:hypothetical protein